MNKNGAPTQGRLKLTPFKGSVRRSVKSSVDKDCLSERFKTYPSKSSARKIGYDMTNESNCKYRTERMVAITKKEKLPISKRMNDRTKNAKHGRRSEMSRNIRWAKEFIDGREHGKWNKISGFAAEKCQRKGVAIEPGSIVKATRSGLKFCEQMAEQCLRKLSTKKEQPAAHSKGIGA